MTQNNPAEMNNVAEAAKIADLPLKQRRNKRLLALAGAVILIGVASTAYWSLYASHFVFTDNAYTAAEIAHITPAVGGTISAVMVKDTQAVKKGDVLIEIDPTDAKLAVAQAEADLDRTIRREALVESGFVSGDELTKAKNAYAAAEANLADAKAAATQAGANLRSAKAAKDANAALIADTSVEANPEVAAVRARLDQAKVDLARTVLRAPLNGVVAKRQVQLGQRVQSGMPLMAVVPVNEMYVDANFKEVQLAKVRVGQPVKLHADLYGKDVTDRGTVEGFSGGSGSAFSAIPAQNATGNWIKVVQRLPVRVKLGPTELQANPLKVGLSMRAKIDTRGQKS